ncbi:hypothetical protein GGS20DRAFT_572044 [Poronia punctata]|nr:hypothetical protein GGS20DRAFT_572044 [Poronia punctata]
MLNIASFNSVEQPVYTTMSFTKDLFSKRRHDNGSMLWYPTSPLSHSVDGHTLAELSPRPDKAILVNDFLGAGPSSSVRDGANPVDANKSSGDGTNTSVSFQDPSYLPSGNGGGNHDFKVGRKGYDEREEKLIPGIWRPSFLNRPHERYTGNERTHLSFFQSMFQARAPFSERAPASKVDQSFRILERRERQIEQELQNLLDAQDYALEKHLADTSSGDDVAPPLESPEPNTSHGHIVPVRQPKKRYLSKQEARFGILRCMNQLLDLKAEENTYIVAALAQRKEALSRLLDLSTKRNSVVAEMKAIESDNDQPQRMEIRNMEHRYGEVCDDILRLEEKLRDLKRTKTELEGRIAEAKSARDSELSGYRGALNECDRSIKNIMDYPEIAVLELEAFMARDAELQSLLGQHVSGFEFLSLRPERRTLPMAQDWWEGEMQFLELRKASVDEERAALYEGTQLWQDVLGRLEGHDRRLKLALNIISRASSRQQKSDLDEMTETLTRQYAMCKKMAKELEDLHDFTTGKGWKLLVTALSAEVDYFHRLKRQLGDTLHAVGLSDGLVTPLSPMLLDGRIEDHLPAVEDDKGMGSDLARSTIPRQDRTNKLWRKTFAETGDGEAQGFAGGPRAGSDDEHNDVPREFLSMHSPSPMPRNEGMDVRTAMAELAEGDAREVRHPRHNEEQGPKKRHQLSRESSANEVPPDLLAENDHVG